MKLPKLKKFEVQIRSRFEIHDVELGYGDTLSIINHGETERQFEIQYPFRLFRKPKLVITLRPDLYYKTHVL